MNRVHCFVLSMGCLLATIGLADGQTPLNEFAVTSWL